MHKRISIEDEYHYVTKIVVIGDSGVGKTNILTRFISGEFNQNTKSTLGVEFATKLIISNDKKIRLQIWDTAGQERYKAITNSYYVNAKGAIVVFDLSKPKSFESIERWVKELRSISGKDCIVMLVGNKSDIKDSRAISEQEAKSLANELNLEYSETSALTNTNINQVFQRLVDQIYQNFIMKMTLDERVDELKRSRLGSSQVGEKRCNC